MAGLGGASLAFAVSAPEQAWWVLGLIVVALLAGPHVIQWWLSRAGRTERLAARWWDAGPGPAEVAFLCGGPDRVVDLVLTDLVAERRVTLGDDGRLALAGPAADDGLGQAGPVADGSGQAGPVADGSGQAGPVADGSGQAGPVADGPGPAGPADRSGLAPGDDGDFRRQILNRLGYGPADV